MTRLVLFDIDGTLLLTGGAGDRAMRQAGRDVFGSRIRWEGVNSAGSLDPVILEDAARQSGVPLGPAEHTAFRERYILYLEDDLRDHAHKLRVLPGVHSLLDELHRHDAVVLGLLTGNYEAAANLKLAAAGFDRSWFRVGAFGDEAEARPGLVGVALERYRREFSDSLEPSQVVIVGDTPRDVHCARVNGCVAFAVATGRYSLEELTAEAHVAVESLADPAPLLELLGVG